jgi:hypothetical protein
MKGHDVLETYMPHSRPPLADAVDLSQVTVEKAEASGKPFGQAEHDTIQKTLDVIATDWIKQLQLVRKHCEQLEQHVIARTARIKQDITQLFLLGSGAQQEARRGVDVTDRLRRELEEKVNV